MTTTALKADKTSWHFLTAWFKKLADHIKQTHARRQTLKELQALSDRELRDIGISRCDIVGVAQRVAKEAIRG